MKDLPELLQTRDLRIGIPLNNGEFNIVRDINLGIRAGEAIGLVGESGSGKSTIALSMMGFLGSGLEVLEGSSSFEGSFVFDLPLAELQKLRGGRLGLIPQNAGQALSPNLRISAQLIEALELHSDVATTDRQARMVELLSQVRLPDPEVILERYPHQLSGGQQQRVAIAMALAGEPDGLILDEPTTGLDVTTQAHILELLAQLRVERNLAMVFVSHDLGVIARVCTRVVVLYAGEIAEDGPVAEVLRKPVHPYTRGLIASIPKLSDAAIPASLEGRPPAPDQRSGGCLFAPRCMHSTDICTQTKPNSRPAGSGHVVRCHHAEKIVQGAAMPESTQREQVSLGEPIVTLENVQIRYDQPGLIDRLTGKPRPTPTCDRVDLTIRAGETLALVGESGSGKSTILKAISGLVPPSQGRILDRAGQTLPPYLDNRTKDQKRRFQMVFQNPDLSLNPRQTVEEIIGSPLKLYEGLAGQALRNRVVNLLDQVRLGASYLRKLPSQMSGGEKQRIGIARAFAARPDLILCDEVTSALDVSVQAAVLSLLVDLQAETGTALLFVSHDLAVVRAISDKVMVLYQGRMCELGSAESVFAEPYHPYASTLLNAALEPDPDKAPILLADDVTELSPPAKGCPFQRRCAHRIGEICDSERPGNALGADNPHEILCHLKESQLQSI
ncbi:ABC transporter ATP-binding protein [Roseovarius sp. EL26]|uniref:dipeptide ABC transporter ATP-binding protein n=1 Tax=Roseovarius sp. EL26 TaxID=2126672 RepID=UPI000EA2AE27|nr:ABC transporter ATP-binding protein [Roseovarius sp. EL26]